LLKFKICEMSVPSTEIFGKMTQNSAYDANGSFAQLLDWHLVHGTRPTGNVEVDGKQWGNKDFAYCVGVVERTVRNWRSSETVPDYIGSIERELFGENPAYAAWRATLRTAHHTAQNGKTSTETETPSQQTFANHNLTLRVLVREVLEAFGGRHPIFAGRIAIPLALLSDFSTLGNRLALWGLGLSLTAFFPCLALVLLRTRYRRHYKFPCVVAFVFAASFGAVAGLEWLAGADEVGIMAKTFPAVAHFQQRMYDEFYALLGAIRKNTEALIETQTHQTELIEAGETARQRDAEATKERAQKLISANQDIKTDTTVLRKETEHLDTTLQGVHDATRGVVIDVASSRVGIADLQNRLADAEAARKRDAEAARQREQQFIIRTDEIYALLLSGTRSHPSNNHFAIGQKPSELKSTATRDVRLSRVQKLLELGKYDQAALQATTIALQNEQLPDSNRRTSAAAHIILASIARSKKEYDKAIQEYGNAIALDATNANTYNDRGVTYYDKGDYDEAIGDYTEAIRRSPRFSWPYNNRGNAFLSKDEPEQATADYKRAIALDVKSPRPYIGLGNVALQQRHNDIAIEYYSHAIKLNSTVADAYNGRGAAYYQQQSYERAIADFDKAIKHNPHYALAFANRGQVYLSIGDIGRAFINSDTAITNDPNLAFAYGIRGLAYAMQLKDDLAFADFDTAITLDQKEAGYYVLRGAVYIDRRKYKDAIAQFDTALSADSKTPLANVLRGIAYAFTGDLERAIDDVSTGIDIDPRSMIAFVYRGFMYAERRDYARALEDMSMAIDIAPGAPLPYISRGMLLFVQKDFKGAERDIDHAISLAPRLSNGYAARGWLLHQQRRYEEAIREYSRAISLNELSNVAFFSRGMAYYDMREYESALSDLDKAIALGRGDDAGIYLDRGNIFTAIENYDQAVKEYSRAIELNSSTGAIVGLAQAYLKRKDKVLAFLAFDKALALSGDKAEVKAQVLAARAAAYEEDLQHEKAIIDYNKAIELDSTELYYFINRGLAKEYLLDHDGAIEDYTHVIELKGKLLGAAYHNRGNVYLGLSNYAAAIADYTDAIALEDDFWALISRADAFFAKKDFGAARSDLDAAIARAPVAFLYVKRGQVHRAVSESASGYGERGTTYPDVGRVTEAIADFTEAIRIEPKNTYAFSERGATYRDMGKVSEAIADFTEAISIDPKDVYAYGRRGTIYRGLGRVTEAIADFTEVIRIKPKEAYGYIRRGTTYREMGKLKAAIEDYSVALDVDPTYRHEAYNNRCYARAIAGDLNDALLDCNEALRIEVDSATLDSRGFTYLKLGRWDEAIGDFDAALAMDSKFAPSLFGRGVAKYKKGERDAGNADMADAKTIRGDIDTEFITYGVEWALPFGETSPR
jgi:tetratricopeptide (TPR) repeat protein